MSEQAPFDPNQPKDADDPVARFFAAERQAVGEASADDLRWQSVVRGARRARRTSILRYAASAAAVVVVAGAAVWGVALRTQHSEAVVASLPQVTRTVYVSATPTPSGTGSTTTPPGVTQSPSANTTATAAVPVPTDFRVVSLTTVGSGQLFALGSMACQGNPCAGLAVSEDGGATWSLRSTLPGETVPSRSATSGSTAARGAVRTTGTVTDVRFADERIGWAYGADVLRTADGGRTWAPYAHTGGAAVVDLATDGTDVVLATASACDGASCAGDLTIVRALKSASSATTSGDVAGTMSATGGVSSARVSWFGSRPVVSAVSANDTAVTPVVVGVAGLVPLQPPGCVPDGRSSQVVAPASGTSLYVLCPTSPTSPHYPYATFVTDDLGSTWTTASGGGTGQIDLPAGLVSGAGTDADHLLVATTQGSLATAGGMVRTSDGGATWTSVSAPPRPTGSSVGWTWVGSPGGTRLYAITDSPDAGFWRSSDNGVTWTQVQVAG